MAENLSWNIFPLLNQANTNDADRPGSLLLEYHDEIFTIATLEESIEVPTNLDVVLGLIDLKYLSGGAADPTDTMQLHTDGVISTGAVTVNATCLDIGNGEVHGRFILVGTKSPTVLINTPSE